MSGLELSFLHSLFSNNKSIIKNQEQKNPQRLSNPLCIDNKLKYPSPTQFVSVQVPSSRKLASIPLMPSKNQTFLLYWFLLLAIQKSRVQFQNSLFSELFLFSSKKTLSASQKNLFLTPIPKVVLSYGKSAVFIDSFLSLAVKNSGNKRVSLSKKSSSYVIDPEFLAKQKFLTAKV